MGWHCFEEFCIIVDMGKLPSWFSFFSSFRLISFFNSYITFTFQILVIPVLIGLLFELLVIVPMRVPVDESPVFLLYQDWALGLIFLKIWTRLVRVQLLSSMDAFIFLRRVRIIFLSFFYLKAKIACARAHKQTPSTILGFEKSKTHMLPSNGLWLCRMRKQYFFS